MLFVFLAIKVLFPKTNFGYMKTEDFGYMTTEDFGYMTTEDFFKDTTSTTQWCYTERDLDRSYSWDFMEGDRTRDI